MLPPHHGDDKWMVPSSKFTYLQVKNQSEAMEQLRADAATMKTPLTEE